MKVIFLDIDGVLNKYHYPYDAWAPEFDNDLVRRLNEIILATEAKIVVSSSWRKHVHNGYMTVLGFWRMLCSHGMTRLVEVIDVTRPSKNSEDDADYDFRHHQIADWLWDHRGDVQAFVILDDFSIKGYPDNFIQTSDATGLTEEHVERAIKILGRC